MTWRPDAGECAQKVRNPGKAAAFARCNWRPLAAMALAFMAIACWAASMLILANGGNMLMVWDSGLLFASVGFVAALLMVNEWWYEWRDVGVRRA